MITTTEMKNLLDTLLHGYGISEFSLDWITGSQGTDENSITATYQALQNLGLSNEKIASQAHLLGMNPDTTERNYKALQNLGLSNEKIASQAYLLGMNPDTIERNYKALQNLGLSNEKIASRAELLGRDPDTIERNYQHHIGLLRTDYKDRESGKGVILNQAQLLGIPPETIEANVQYLVSIGVNYYSNAALLGTRPQTKRKKIAWILRELIGYEHLLPGQKKRALSGVYDFIYNNPGILSKSINSMEKNRDDLKKRVLAYV